MSVTMQAAATASVFDSVLNAMDRLFTGYVGPQDGETEADFCERVEADIRALDDAGWASLPENVQLWYNDYYNAVNTPGAQLPPMDGFPFYEPLPDEVEPTVEAEAKAETVDANLGAPPFDIVTAIGQLDFMLGSLIGALSQAHADGSHVVADYAVAVGHTSKALEALKNTLTLTQ